MSNFNDVESILIVDDNAQNIALLMQMLEPLQLDISIATGGMQALELLEHHIPELVLLDVMMPDLDGYETCRRIRKNPRTRDVPVVFVSALSDEQHLAEGFDAGANDYITKPLRHSEVLARVNTQLRIHAMLNFQRRLVETMEEKIHSTSEQIGAMGENIMGRLHVIMGFSKVLNAQAKINSTEVLEHCQSAIATAGKEISRTLSNLLDLVKIESGGIIPQPHVFSMDEFLEQIEKSYKEVATCGHALRIQPPGEMTIETDDTILLKLFCILLENADQHMGGGSIDVQYEARDDSILFFIRNGGLGFGIEADRMPLKKFLQKLNTSGLGLRIASKLAGILGCEIRVTTGEKGSCFELLVHPLSLEEAMEMRFGSAGLPPRKV